MDRRYGVITFRLVQVLSGHGCFGHYLHHKAGKEPTTRCHHCEEDQDTAQHILEFCPAWAEQRRVLVDTIAADLSPPALFRTMLSGERGWEAISSFCETVVSQREEAEKVREGDSLAHPMRARRGGARRRAYDRLHL